MCIATYVRPSRPTRGSISPLWQPASPSIPSPAVTSLTMKSPTRSYAFRTTEGQYVSMEMRISGSSSLSAFSAGSSLRHSSSSPTAVEPGLVEQAPISRIEAPSSAILTALSTIFPMSSLPSSPRQRLSLKYELSVILMIPITSILRIVSIKKILRKLKEKFDIFVELMLILCLL